MVVDAARPQGLGTLVVLNNARVGGLGHAIARSGRREGGDYNVYIREEGKIPCSNAVSS